ncbi:MAG: hypothetical protein VXY93_11835, partial [Pseudomonadota bacterium]|nr:hypothetical protein [Pseudomonadota bacterium]
KPNENYDTHNINSTGIVTAIGLDINGNGDISGNLSVGGVLTYEDVTSIDSVGIITARGGIDCNGDIDVDGHTNLDNVSVAGVTTFSNTVHVGTGITFETNGQGTFSGIVTSRGLNVSYSNDNGVTNSFIAGRIKIFDPGSQCQIQFGSGPSYSPHQKYASVMTYRTNAFTLQNTGTTRTALSWVNSDGPVNLWYSGGYAPDYSIKLSTHSGGINVAGVTTTRDLAVTGVSTFTGAIDANGDLDVDGHTNLDNVSVAGVTTMSGNLTVSNSAPTIFLTDSNGNDFSLVANGSVFRLRDETNGEDRLTLNSSGHLHLMTPAISLGEATFGSSSITKVYSGTGGIKKNALMVLNPTASVAGRGAGVAVGAIGTGDDYI